MFCSECLWFQHVSQVRSGAEAHIFPRCVMPPSSSPLFFSILQRFLCAVRRGLLIHLVFLLLCVSSPHTAKNKCLVQPPALSQLTSLLFTVYPSEESLVLGQTGSRCSVFHQVLVTVDEFSLNFFFLVWCNVFSVHFVSSSQLQLHVLHYNLSAISALFLAAIYNHAHSVFFRLFTVSWLSFVNTRAKWNGPILSEGLAGQL